MAELSGRATPIVLVHGAWHGAWCWTPVMSHLRAYGHPVVLAPTMPVGPDPIGGAAPGLDGARRALIECLERHDLRDVVLVVHSWGGMVLAAALDAIADRIRAAIYLSAFVPLPGESALDLLPATQGERFVQLAAESGDGTVAPSWSTWTRYFMGDADESARRLAYSLLVPQHLSTYSSVVPEVDYGALAGRVDYALFSRDAALPPGEHYWVPRFPDRLGVERWWRIDADHEAPITAPRLVAEFLHDRIGA